MFLFFLWKGAGWGMRALRAYSNIGYGSLGAQQSGIGPNYPDTQPNPRRPKLPTSPRSEPLQKRAGGAP